HDLPGPGDCQADVSESFCGPGDATRHRPLCERPVPTPPLGAADTDELSSQRQVAAENRSEGEPVRLRPLPASHEGNRLPRRVRPALWRSGQHTQLELYVSDQLTSGCR